MSEHSHAYTELDKQIQDGFSHFQKSCTPLYGGISEAYTQGFIDGLRSNLNALLEAYKLDIIKEKDKDK